MTKEKLLNKQMAGIKANRDESSTGTKCDSELLEKTAYAI